MFALRDKQNPAGNAFEIEKGNGDVRDYNIAYSSMIQVLVVRTPVASLSFQVQHTWYVVGYMQAPNGLYKLEVRGSVSRVKTPREQGLPHCTKEKATSSFPMERGPTANHHSSWNLQCMQWFRAEEVPPHLLHTESHATLQSR